MHVLASYAVCMEWYSSFLIIRQVGLHMYSCVYALTTYAVTVHVQSVMSRACSLLTWCMPQYAVSCATQCMQSGKHEKSSKTSKTYVKVRMCAIIHVLMYAVLQHTGHTNAHPLTLWQGMGTPRRHCSIVIQIIDFYSARVCSV